jgi:DNA-binding NtrC family response regulator
MRLLLVEDKDSFRKMLLQALEGSGFDVEGYGDPQEAIRALERNAFQVLVTDLRLPSFNGLELIQRAKRLQPSLRVLLMSAFGEPRDIVEAMQAGADDFLPKPFDLNVFLSLLGRLRGLAEAPPPHAQEPWVVVSPAMRALDEALRKASERRDPVGFFGPRGSGKGRAARRLHTLRHPKGPYRALSAPTLDGRGVLDLDRLKGGSVYLHSMDLVRPEAAEAVMQQMDAHPEISWMVGAAGPLAPRLQERMAVLALHVLGLKDRREDILPLFRLSLERACSREGHLTPTLDRGAERELLEHAWPGNLREVEALALRTAKHPRGLVLRGFPDLGLGEAEPMLLPWPEEGSLEAMQKAVARLAEPRLFRRALERAGGDLGKAADSLGLTPRVLGQRLKEHGIPLEEG